MCELRENRKKNNKRWLSRQVNYIQSNSTKNQRIKQNMYNHIFFSLSINRFANFLCTSSRIMIRNYSADIHCCCWCCCCNYCSSLMIFHVFSRYLFVIKFKTILIGRLYSSCLIILFYTKKCSVHNKSHIIGRLISCSD